MNFLISSSAQVWRTNPIGCWTNHNSSKKERHYGNAFLTVTTEVTDQIKTDQNSDQRGSVLEGLNLIRRNMDSRLKPEIDDEEEDDERPPRLMTTESQAFSETPAVVDPPSSRVSFVCQRCLQPLTIDPSFSSMNEHVTAELSLPISPVPPLPAAAESALASRAPEMDR